MVLTAARLEPSPQDLMRDVAQLSHWPRGVFSFSGNKPVFQALIKAQRVFGKSARGF